ncbi:MAG TPA: ATP-binding protein [Cellulomonas sp.]|nr:ATP-binding protein [Cellulomonas sp.]
MAIALVVVTAGLTAWLVAGAIGPATFHSHMLQAGASNDRVAVLHAEEAFRSSSALSLSVALAAAVLAALAVSLFLTRRIGRSLAALSTAAARVAGGRFDAHVTSPHLGVEFDELAEAFNAMSARLHDSESLRQRLLADVAHELRTPVATLTAYLEGLEDGVESLTPATVAVLRAQASRLTLLAHDLAAVTQAESGELVLQRVRATPQEIVAAATLPAGDRFAARGLELATRISPHLPPLYVDRDRMGQVLGNLLDNALRHTPAGGVVTVRAEAAHHGAVRIVVEDTGEGIEPQHLPHLFERFYRVDTARDRTHGGSGIGLAITKALVEAQGGTITATSAGPGHGTTFEILLPAADATL